MRIDNQHNIGETVYLITDDEQLQYMVTGILIRDGGRLVYELSHASECSDHYDFEISKNKAL